MRWPAARAQKWYEEHSWEIGANFIPSTASNQLDMWQAATFDAATIDRELGFARELGMSVMRVFLHDLAYALDPLGFKQRVGQLLSISDKHGIRIMLVLFDGCWSPEGSSGLQPEPLPNVHNSRWLQSPFRKTLRDVRQWANLEAYVKDVMSSFGKDPRVHSWDLYNEVDNTVIDKLCWLKTRVGLTNASDIDLRFKLLCQTFAWAREIDLLQPLTVGEWEYMGQRFRMVAQEESDIGTFHIYAKSRATEAEILRMKKAYPGRPLLLTEYMARSVGSTFKSVLPILKQHGVGAINWGLVRGKTNTVWPWWSWIFAWQWWNRLATMLLRMAGRTVSEPYPWFHDVLWPDGTAYDQAEVELVCRLACRYRSACAG